MEIYAAILKINVKSHTVHTYTHTHRVNGPGIIFSNKSILNDTNDEAYYSLKSLIYTYNIM